MPFPRSFIKQFQRSMIPQQTVQEIMETAKIEEVVGDYVNLKRRGANLIGLCPFHNEKTPSFTVSPAKNIYKCFGCGKGGTPVQFVMEHEGFTFVEALRQIAKRYNIEIVEKELSPEARTALQKKDSLFIVNEYAKQFFKDNLFKTPAGKNIGLTYFKERGFNQMTIEKFNLGFALNAKDQLTLKAVQAGYSIDLLRELGLTTKFDSDFFRDRVMFTIHGLSGKPIAFAGRTLQKNKRIPKYINSPETEIYVKNKVLYGIYFAKQTIRKEDECILVEGYTDVISLHQSGVENVVASSGTSLTVGQIQLIKRYTANIKILYDGDSAGVKAALRGLDLVLEQDMNVRIVLLPDGEDPDSYVQQLGSTQFKTYIEAQAKDFILFKTDLLLKDAANDPIKKTLLIKDIVSSVALIPDPIKRSLYVRECANLMQMEEHLLAAEVNKMLAAKMKRAKLQPQQRATPPPSPIRVIDDTGKATEKKAADAFQERDIIRILVNFCDAVMDDEEQTSISAYILSNIQDVIDTFEHPIYKKAATIALEQLLEDKTLTLNFFLNHTDLEVSKLAVDLITSPHEYSPGWEKREIYLRTQKPPERNYINDSIQSLLRLKLKKIEQLCEQNQERIKSEKDAEKVMTYLKVHQKLLETRNAIAAQLRTVVLR